MSNALINNQTLTDIADAIRSKLGTQATMIPGDMPSNILSIPSGSGVYQEKTVTPTAEAQTIFPDAGYDALSKVKVNGIALQEKSVTLTSAQQIITPDQGYAGLSQVTVPAAPSSGLTLLWSNPNQSSSFAPQTIAIDLSGYSAICMDLKAGTGSVSYYPSENAAKQVIARNGSSWPSAMITVFGGTQTDGYYGYIYRSITVTDSGVQFGNGMMKNKTSSTTSNNYGVPVRIYGIS